MRYVLIAGLLAGLAADAVAWGGKGHRLIASLAEKQLSARRPAAMKEIQALLGPGVSLASIAACADSIREYVSGRNRPGVTLPGNCLVTEQEAVAMFPATGSWHFVNIPVPASPGRRSVILDRACAANGPCILTQIRHFTQQLRNEQLDSKSRAIALMFLVHLVGDLHQPLHAVARNQDRGGNEVFVRLGAHTSRLHGLWDSFFVEPLEESDVAVVRVRAGGTASSWAWESYEAARSSVYNSVPIRASTQENPIVLPERAYTNAAVTVVKRRLRQASIRLADVLASALAN